MTLPESFLDSMKELLGEEYPLYLDSLKQPSHTALRVNTRKISPEEFQRISPFALKQVRWTAKGFLFDASVDAPAKHPYYYAGLYYIQEPSAMIPASLLPVEKGDKVLDLCAAPGGKATELAAKLDGGGLLVANDISVSRAMALAKNLQVAGVTNSVVTAETPERLAGALPGFFDKILVDAPCSGEGMFRRDAGMIKDWLEHGPAYYAPIQRQILSQAYRMLRPGGMMVYSTCTFSPQEDEGMVQWFLDEYPDMTISPVTRQEGFSSGCPSWVTGGKKELEHCVRIFPHRSQGEGHFAVLLKKAGEDSGADSLPECVKNRAGKEKKVSEEMCAFLDEIKNLSLEENVLSPKKDTYFLQHHDMKKLAGLRQIYAGLILGEQKKKRFEPSPQLALALGMEDYPRVVNLPSNDQRVIRYLKGETLQVEKVAASAGYVLLCVDGFPLGWCKHNGTGTLKNKYYPGWRIV
jgi:NOL1/NOP2/sun family putative RNA methylase